MKIHIAATDGLHLNEHEAILAIERALPEHWVGYAGILLVDKNRKSLEFDVLIFAEDRILMVELKNFYGKVHMEDHHWIQTTPKGRKIKHGSPIDRKREHAQRIKSMFEDESSALWGDTFYEIQALVVLTGGAEITQKSPKDKGFVLTLEEFLAIKDLDSYFDMMPKTKAERYFQRRPEKRPCAPGQIAIFENWKCGGNRVQLRQRLEAGYVLSEKTPRLKGPKNFYCEFDGEHERDSDDKSQIRVWDFTKMAHIGTDMSVRAFYGLREDRTQRHIRRTNHQLGKDYFLEPKHNLQEDILTFDMAEVYQLPRLAERLDEYLVSSKLSIEERTLLLRSLLTPLASMHAMGVYHRDLSAKRLWWDRERKAIIVSGLTSAKFPNSGCKSISDMRQELDTTGIVLPEDAQGKFEVLGQAIDVFQLGVLCYQIAFGETLTLPHDEPTRWNPPLNDPFEGKLDNFIQKCLKDDPLERYTDASAMLEALTRTLNFQNLDTSEDRDRVLDALAAFSTNVMPITDYPQIETPNTDPLRQRMDFRSQTVDGKPCTVRIYMTARPNKDNHGQSQRLLHFLERCAVASSNVLPIPPLVEFGCGMMGTHVVQSYLPGQNLEQWMELSEHSYGDRYQLADALIRAVHNLHDLDLSHGDLKPENLLVQTEGDKLNILFLDMFDLDLDGLSPTNSEYAPVTDVSATARDRYAVYMIVDELFAACNHPGANKVRGEIRNALGDNNVVPRSLDMLRRTMVHANEPEVVEVPPLVIESSFFSNENGELFEMDSNIYHLTTRYQKRDSMLRLFFHGASHKLTLNIKVDGENLAVHRIFYDRLGTGEMVYDTRNNHKNGNKSMSVEQPFLLKKGEYGAANDDLIRFIKSLQVVQYALDISPVVNDVSTVVSGEQEESLKRLWQRLVEIERETLPTVTVIASPKERDGAVHVQINENIDALEFADDDIINVTADDHETHFGQLDIAKSGNGVLVLSDDNRGNHFRLQNIREDTVLTLSNSGSDVSWERRDRALSRIIAGDAVMRDLTDRFITGSHGEKPPAFPLPSDEKIDSYGLDESKRAAFLYLLQNPLSVLMGPPGTGKTTLLSATLDYLLNDADVRRVLVVSQSHTAVDEVANRVRELSFKRQEQSPEFKLPSIVRLGERRRINESMLDVHTNALQDQARMAFHRDLEVRLLALSARLKLPEAFVLESAALYRACGRELFEFTPARNEVNDAQLDSVELENLPKNKRSAHLAALRRLESLTDALTGRLSAFTDMPTQVLSHKKPLLAVLNMIAERHQINNPQRIERMAEVIKVAHHWYQRLATDETGYAAFAARTRQLVVGTLVGIGHGGYQLDKNAFDLVVIDEAARATFSELAIAMQSAKRVLLVGDYKQLAPSYDVSHVRQVARDLELNEVEVKRTDFERAYYLNDGHMLSKQYRMAPAIGEIISHCFYDGTLSTGRPVAPDWMSSLPIPWNRTVSWIDTSGSKTFETSLDKGVANKFEVDLLCSLLRQLVDDKQAMAQLHLWNDKDTTPAIGVITGYRKQVELLQNRLESEPWAIPIRSMIKVDTIDSYQGSENRIILLSLVRHNTEQKCGFLTDDARVNVALSRAKERLLIVGAGSMWRQADASNPLARVFNYIHEQPNADDSEYQIIRAEDLANNAFSETLETENV
ncbi:TPA: AAA domain-containing protein [Vibrio parahaemolyticus]|uniref:AAA domain-containing protein n=1 Tax=Vibrio parahaemolyticus TaxID=670 RepID=UPI00084A4742|nr:AAA domain-containing protein [Vibrio parahaemolyticus]ODX47438.1 NERD nuclease [Vibrio parahaemolyticus]ODY97566.1 NERD nuclease [Vibrio parahaemolyticus]HAS6459670.1 AAA family ATPase [Vibrio parahaemolyticus]HAS6470381.1 AAA family ATPase [Vibrio parahaemolyticus]